MIMKYEPVVEYEYQYASAEMKKSDKGKYIEVSELVSELQGMINQKSQPNQGFGTDRDEEYHKGTLDAIISKLTESKGDK